VSEALVTFSAGLSSFQHLFGTVQRQCGRLARQQLQLQLVAQGKGGGATTNSVLRRLVISCAILFVGEVVGLFAAKAFGLLSSTLFSPSGMVLYNVLTASGPIFVGVANLIAFSSRPRTFRGGGGSSDADNVRVMTGGQKLRSKSRLRSSSGLTARGATAAASGSEAAAMSSQAGTIAPPSAARPSLRSSSSRVVTPLAPATLVASSLADESRAPSSTAEPSHMSSSAEQGGAS
jgi:hypothetical protein